MVYVKWIFWGTFWVLVAAFFHYTLPKRDIVYITGVEIKMEQFGENSIFWAAPDTGANINDGVVKRDVRFIDTVKTNGRVKVYRNEDTGWGWPPYFKLDSSNLQAEARNLTSTESEPNWVVVRYYGWRMSAMSIFPNAVSVHKVDGPDVRLIPWLNIVILTIVGAVFWAIYVRWRRFRIARIDPAMEEVNQSFEAAGDSLAEGRGRFRNWLDSWKSKTPK
ncbi:DUF1523 family protein [Shimia thalassica]|uniref:DUF1523 family protein n=1 Tax=Shimia thalassica TaxID=1715693 RepID=UPI001C099237|nr:DUF1523 family protein [Shimia thalassica]MBU2943335.1 DUF1523 family protein [Shimia thalassica]MDO6501404.1 DUF1523 family protein [Shimia thalassica]